ncbi:MAG: translation initiation factor IF-3 [Gammaproteobacteria bacterium]
MAQCLLTNLSAVLIVFRPKAGFIFVPYSGDALIADNKQSRLNEEITAPEVRLVAEDGEQKGIVPLAEAQALAEAAKLDLVELVPDAIPPVCRLMDYGKFKFQQKKKLHDQRKKQRQIQIKEIKFRPGTEDGDYQVKLKKLIQFIEVGDRCKVTVRFRGREMAHMELGTNLLKRVEEDMHEFATVDQYPQSEGRQMTMLLMPRKR